jgi:hypothetical protein
MKAIKIVNGHLHLQHPMQRERAGIASCQNVPSVPCQHLYEADNEYDSLTEIWAVELRKMKPDQQLYARKVQ